MRKNGFTLIELLAVIVILAIIALIATPIILGIINDAREESNERSVELYASAVRNGIAAYQLREGKEVLPGTYNESNPLPFEVEYDGNVDCTNVTISEDGKVSLEGCTVNGGEKTYNYGTQQESNKVCTLEDTDSDNIADVGEVVTCTLSESIDNFYVIEEANLATSSTIQLLAEKNINKTTYRQSDNAGTVAFSPNSYWHDENGNNYTVDVNYVSEGRTYPYIYGNYEDNSVYPYVEEYMKYINKTIIGATGKLMSYNQSINLGCTWNPSQFSGTCSSAPSWVTYTAYWLGSTPVAGGHTFAVLDSTNNLALDYPPSQESRAAGVRPVITILTTDLNY